MKKRACIKTAISVAFVFSLFSFSATTRAEDKAVDDSSIIADFANKTFEIELTDGSSIFDRNQGIREKYNNEVIQESKMKNVSLYDRFGGNLKFVPYFGERKFKIGMADRIYSNIKQNNKEFSISASDIFSQSDAQVSSVVYEGRPDVVSDENIESGFIDPRVSAYSSVSDSGGSAALGNLYLTFSNVVTEFVTYLSGEGIYNDAKDAWESLLDSGTYKEFARVIKHVLPLVAIFFLFTMLRSIVRLLKGNESIGKVMIRALNFAVSLGIVFTLLGSPSTFGSITGVFIKAIDDLFTSTLVDDTSEVAKSDDGRYELRATIWEKTVLDPWAKGMFDGRGYNELYTQYAGKGKTKMPQSHQNILAEWKGKEVKYGSATLTGDVKVPLGNGKYVQNWAALAWSTQSIYHIDAVNSESEEVDEEDEETEKGDSLYSWPKATTTPKNNQIFVDNFRWLDAKLNISPGYVTPEDHDGNYKDSEPYKEGFIKYGLKSAFMALLLLPILVPVIRKLKQLLSVLFGSVRWIHMSIMSIIKPDDDHDYNHLTNLKNVFKPLYFYYWWSMTIYIMFFLYLKLTGGVLGSILWLVLSYIILKFKPLTNPNKIRRVYHYAKNLFINR